MVRLPFDGAGTPLGSDFRCKVQRTFAQLLSVEVTPDTTFEKGGRIALPFWLPTAEHAEAAEISRSFLCADGVLGG